MKAAVEQSMQDADEDSVSQDMASQRLKIYSIKTSEGPGDTGIVLDGVTVLTALGNFATACTMLVGLAYAVTLAYPKELSTKPTALMRPNCDLFHVTPPSQAVRMFPLILDQLRLISRSHLDLRPNCSRDEELKSRGEELLSSFLEAGWGLRCYPLFVFQSPGQVQMFAGDPAQHCVSAPSKESLCRVINSFKGENQELAALNAEWKKELDSKSIKWEFERTNLIEGRIYGLQTAKENMDSLAEALEESRARVRGRETRLKDMASTFRAKEEDITCARGSLQRREAETQTLEAKILQNESVWQVRMSVLEDSLTTEREVSIHRMEELQQALRDKNEKMLTEQQDWLSQVTRMEEEIKLLIQENKELQELALMSNKDKVRIKKQEKKSKEAAEKRLKEERRAREEQGKKEKLEREEEEKRKRKEIKKRGEERRNK
ncbi:hypothetical protein F2P81_011553 [Scophthalmus maximus]|uniref:Uncharacterized protein n=1 Tax=Scophthalmus maximus TaxID=52904 RepID=A0A6A4SYZ7_SCOMX|nr:hypothetical protein F2P81_011553 [Scophthalmus maximus]